MARQRIGSRRHFADFYRQDGTKDAHGIPDYSDDATWTRVIHAWPCELITASGGERVRGRQVTAATTHVAIGEYYGAREADPDMRAEIGGRRFAIAAAYDPDGDNRETRVELRIER